MKISRLLFTGLLLALPSTLAFEQASLSDKPFTLKAKLIAEAFPREFGPNRFGHSVAISGDTVVVGAPEDSQCCSGRAFVFVKPATGWASATPSVTLSPSDSSPGDTFGSSVAIDGDVAVIGAPDAGGVGTIYVFVKPATGWASTTPMHESAKLVASDGANGDTLGWSVAISGNTVVVGAVNAPLDQSNGFPGPGAAYVFVRPITGWASTMPIYETAKLTASDGVPGDAFGASVAISAKTVVVGAPAASIGTKIQQGAGYVFVRPQSGWASATPIPYDAKLIAPDGASFDSLGSSVAISNKTIVVGAPAAMGQQGAAYLLPVSNAHIREITKLTASDGVPFDAFGTSVAIQHGTVLIGSPSDCFFPVPVCAPSDGAAYVFAKPASGWFSTSVIHESSKLTVANPFPTIELPFFFGQSVAINHGTLVVSSGSLILGSAYVFQHQEEQE